jgi:hypothetical protein
MLLLLLGFDDLRSVWVRAHICCLVMTQLSVCVLLNSADALMSTLQPAAGDDAAECVLLLLLPPFVDV